MLCRRAGVVTNLGTFHFLELSGPKVSRLRAFLVTGTKRFQELQGFQDLLLISWNLLTFLVLFGIKVCVSTCCFGSIKKYRVHSLKGGEGRDDDITRTTRTNSEDTGAQDVIKQAGGGGEARYAGRLGRTNS